jgi:hypothetical protein
MGKAKHHRSATGQQLQTAVKPEIKEVAQDPKPACNATREPRFTVGSEVKILKDYLDMKDLPAENGLPNCGYLVLRKGDLVRLLYVGSAQTDDPGWLYGEVIQCLSRGGAGRRGWLPVSVAEPPPEPKAEAPPRALAGSTEVPKVAESTPSVQSAKRQSVGYPPNRGSAVPKQKSPQAAIVVDPTSPPPPCTLSSAFAVASQKSNSSQRGGKAASKAVQSRQQMPVSSAEAFPALPGHSGRSWWEEESGEPVSMSSSSKPAAPPNPPRPRDVEGTIARHRAMAAAAAEKAKASNGKTAGKTCPICMEPFTAQRRIAQLPCCGVTLCTACSETSIKGGRCYFCRETAEEFPSLAASAGRSIL